MNWPIDAEREFWRRKCHDSFWWAFRYGWGYDFNPKGAAGPRPWLDERIHKPVCDWYQQHALEWLEWRRLGLNRSKHLLCVVPRDLGKTTLLAQAGQWWLHLHDPELATYTGCDTVLRAREILDGIKQVISGQDEYSRAAWLYGNQKHPYRRWKVDGVVTSARTNLTRRDASYGVWAIGSGLTGMHPDGCFLDDPNTYEQIQRARDWLDIVNQHYSTLIPVFQSDAIWMLTATRYGTMDHVGKIIRDEGVASVSGMPMPGVTVDPDGIWHIYYLDVLDKDEQPTMPTIWPMDRIRRFERANPLRYWAQVRNNPHKSPHNTLTLEVAERYIVEPKTVDTRKLRISFHLDTAFKHLKRRTRGDDNVIVKIGHKTDGSGQLVFMGARWGNTWDSERLARELVEMVQSARADGHFVSCVTDEEEIGGKPGIWPAFLHNAFALRNLRPGLPTLIILKRGGTRKEERLEEAAAHWRNGRVILLKDAPGLDILVQQMTHIGPNEPSDFADAFTDGFNKEVYTTVWQKGSVAKAGASGNPFDDILKPGMTGIMAAEKIADMYDEAERNSEFWGVVRS